MPDLPPEIKKMYEEAYLTVYNNYKETDPIIADTMRLMSAGISLIDDTTIAIKIKHPLEISETIDISNKTQSSRSYIEHTLDTMIKSIVTSIKLEAAAISYNQQKQHPETTIFNNRKVYLTPTPGLPGNVILISPELYQDLALEGKIVPEHQE